MYYFPRDLLSPQAKALHTCTHSSREGSTEPLVQGRWPEGAPLWKITPGAGEQEKRIVGP